MKIKSKEISESFINDMNKNVKMLKFQFSVNRTKLN